MGEVTVKELFYYVWNFGLPVVMSGIWTYAVYKGWYVPARELTACELRCTEQKTLTDKWEGVALRLLHGNEKLVADKTESVGKR